MEVGMRAILSPSPERVGKYSGLAIGLVGVVSEIFKNGKNGYDWDAELTFEDLREKFFPNNKQYVKWCDCIILQDREIDTNELSALDLF